MAARFPGFVGQGFAPIQFGGFVRPPYSFPIHRSLSISEALELSEKEWNVIKKRIKDIDFALTKVLGKSTEKPTLRKILISWNEKKGILSESENEILEIFFAILERLAKVRDAMSIIHVLKGSIELNPIFCDTTVHKTVHEEVLELVRKGVALSSRFRATISVIPRLLDCLYRISGSNRRAPKTEQQTSEPDVPTSSSKPDSPKEKPHKESSEKPRETSESEDEEDEHAEMFNDNPDMEFQMWQHFEDFMDMQRRAAYHRIYERKCTETDHLRKENADLLNSLQNSKKEIETLQKEIKVKGKTGASQSFNTETKQQTRPNEHSSLDLQIQTILRRLDQLEADQEKRQKSTEIRDHETNETDHLQQHLKYFRRRLAELPDHEQLNFIYRTSNFAAGYFDDRGGFLEIEALNVSLFVPPGAIQSAEKTEVYIYVDTERQPIPCPGQSQTLVAPIVQCGPPGLHFHESVVLTFPHCAEEENDWEFSALTCQSDERHQAKGDWTDLAMDDAICMVNNGRTVLLVNHFTLYTLAGEQKTETSIVKKKMRVGAFGPPFSNGQESYQFRVRAWDDTEASFDQVMKKEDRLSGHQLDDDRPISVANTGEPVDVNMSHLKTGWKNRYDEPEGQLIPFNDMWQSDVLPSCTFDVEQDNTSSKNNNPRVDSGVHCMIALQQRKSADDAVNLKINVSGSAEVKGGHVSKSHQTFSGAVQEKLFGPFDPKSGLSTKAYYELCEDLNMERAIPLDWRLLADKLGCSFMTIENIRGNRSEEPAKLVLKVFFSFWNVSAKKQESAVEFLMKKLKEIGLASAAKIIEDDLAGIQTDE